MNRWELEQKIVIKALKDPAFKKQLLEQPKEALREFFKSDKTVNLSNLDKFNVRVIEENKSEWVLSLPYMTEKMASLSDAELEKLFAAAPGEFDAIVEDQPPR